MTRQVLGAVACNTQTATYIAEFDGITLYRTKTWRFFFEKGGQLTLVDNKVAYEWLLSHGGPKLAEKAFETISVIRLTLDLPVELVEKIDAAKTERLRSRRAVIQALLEKALRKS